MTTDAAPDLETRLRQWVLDVTTTWKHDDKWLREHIYQAAELIRESAVDLTACRAEQARLHEEQGYLERNAYGLGYAKAQTEQCKSCHQCGSRLDKESPNGGLRCSDCDERDNYCDELETKLEKEAAQVSTLTAELDLANEAATRWRTQLASTMASGPYVAPDGSVPTFAGVVPNLASEREATLTAALRRYGQHKQNCATTRARDFCRQHGGDGSINGCPACQNLPLTPDCTCGLAAVLRAASEGAP